MVFILKVLSQWLSITDTLEGRVHEAGVAKVTETSGTRLDMDILWFALMLVLVLLLHLLYQSYHLLRPGVVLVTSYSHQEYRVHNNIEIGTEREREGERGSHREGFTERGKERESQREREEFTERGRERESQREGERRREREREGVTEREKEKERGRERESQREGERGRERESQREGERGRE